MADRKSTPALPAYEQEHESSSAPQAYKHALTEGGNRRLPTEGRDLNGWDAYRRWLSRVQAPDTRRNAADPALYTWKGYRSWADKVRRDWKSED